MDLELLNLSFWSKSFWCSLSYKQNQIQKFLEKFPMENFDVYDMCLCNYVPSLLGYFVMGFSTKVFKMITT